MNTISAMQERLSINKHDKKHLMILNLAAITPTRDKAILHTH